MKTAITNCGICLCLSFLYWSLQAQLALHVEQDKTVLFGQDTMGQGTKLMWVPSKSAFRTGFAIGTDWDYDSLGINSTAMGSNTSATGINSTAMGYNTSASAFASTAMGGSNSASESYSIAMGLRNSASGSVSTAMGRDNTASGDYSTAMGRDNFASGDYSTAMGYDTRASSAYSTAMGRGTIAGVNYSTAIGAYNNYGGAIFDVGIGTSNKNRKSALTAWNTGSVNIGKTGTGRLGIRTLPTHELHVVHAGSINGATGFKLQNSGSNNNWWTLYTANGSGKLEFYYKSALRAQILPSDGSYVKSSDRRLKHNVRGLPMTNNKLMLLKPSSYLWRDQPKSDRRSIGFIAQQVQPLFPELVHQGSDGEENYLSLDYDGFVVLAIKAIQEQQVMIKELQKEVGELRSLIDFARSVDQVR